MNNHAQLTFRCPHCERMSCYDLPETIAIQATKTKGIYHRYPAIAQALEQIAERHGMSLTAMISVKRERIFVDARCEAAVYLRNSTDLSLAEIGGVLGGRNHSSVIHMLNRGNSKHPT